MLVASVGGSRVERVDEAQLRDLSQSLDLGTSDYLHQVLIKLHISPYHTTNCGSTVSSAVPWPGFFINTRGITMDGVDYTRRVHSCTRQLFD